MEDRKPETAPWHLRVLEFRRAAQPVFSPPASNSPPWRLHHEVQLPPCAGKCAGFPTAPCTPLTALAKRFAGLLLAALILPLVGLAAEPPDGSGPCIIPWPQHIDLGQGTLTLSDKSRIMAEGDSLAELAKILSDEIYQTSGVRLATAMGKGQGGDIVACSTRRSRARPTWSR